MNNSLLTNLIGYTATVIGTFLMLPQVIQSLRTKKVGDVSMGMVVLYVLNCFFWLIYGLLLNAPPLLIANSIGLVISIFQLVLKLKYGRRRAANS